MGGWCVDPWGVGKGVCDWYRGREILNSTPALKIWVRGALSCQVALEAFALVLEGVDFARACGRDVGASPAAHGIAAGAGEEILHALLRVVVEHGVGDVIEEETILLDHPLEELGGADELFFLVLGEVEAGGVDIIVGSRRVSWI